jgi:hypothetical protein
LAGLFLSLQTPYAFEVYTDEYDGLTVDDFDFSGDIVPEKAIELTAYYYHRLTPLAPEDYDLEFYAVRPIREDYWLPWCDITGELIYYTILGYHGPGEAPPIEGIIDDAAGLIAAGLPVNSLGGTDYAKYMSYCYIESNYYGRDGYGYGVPVCIEYRSVADDIAESHFDSDQFTIKYVEFNHMEWGYIYSHGDDEIYIRLDDIFKNKCIVYDRDTIIERLVGPREKPYEEGGPTVRVIDGKFHPESEERKRELVNNGKIFWEGLIEKLLNEVECIDSGNMDGRVEDRRFY